MSTPAYEERDGIIYVRCRYCNDFVPNTTLGRHLRAHRSPERKLALQPQSHRYSGNSRAARDRRSQAIKEFCITRNIENLVHFTRIESLSRILREGLLFRSTLEKQARKGRKFIAVDQDRFDGYKNTVSLSVSFPNYHMFYSVRQQTSDEVWVILTLNASVLWELDCAFFSENAASARMRHHKILNLRKVLSLHRMFAETIFLKGGTVSRADLLLPPHFPTNPQAEVLVREPIIPKYITKVLFYNRSVLRDWSQANGTDWENKEFDVNHGFFRSRPCRWDEIMKRHER